MDRDKADVTDVEWSDMCACYAAIQAAGEVRKFSGSRQGLNRDGTHRQGAHYTHIPMEMWEVLQPVIETDVKR